MKFRFFRKAALPVVTPVLKDALTEVGARLMALDAARSFHGTKASYSVSSLRLLRR